MTFADTAARRPLARRRPGRRTAAVTLAVAYSVLAAPLAPFSWPMRAVTAAPVLGMALLAWRHGWHRPGPRPPSGSAPRPDWAWALVWIGIIGVIAAFQLSMFFSAPRDVYPTASSLAAVGFGWWPVRAAAFAGWLAFGWYLVRR